MHVGAKHKHESIFFQHAGMKEKCMLVQNFHASIAAAEQRIVRPHVFRVTHDYVLLICTMTSDTH